MGDRQLGHACHLRGIRQCRIGAIEQRLPVAQMKDEHFKGIVAGLENAIAFVQGDSTRGRVAAGPDVKAIRAKTRLSQAKFADKLRVPVATVRDWEQHRRSPDAPARTLLGMVDADPKAALDLIARMAG